MIDENKKLAFEYAKKEMPREACGLVAIIKGKEHFFPCRNISPYEGRFELHPDDFAAVEELGELTEVWHSHCYGSPRPSMVDKVAAESTTLKWSIVSVPTGDWFEFSPSGYRAPLIGREWAHGLADCYTLLKDYYFEKLQIVLPEFERKFEWWLQGQDLYSENFESSGFRQVDRKDIQEHDIVLMQIGAKVINHGAVYIGDGKILQHLHRRLSSRDVFDGYWAKHLRKVVRHHSL